MESNKQWVSMLRPLCEGLARLLSPHAEVVLHDVATDTIVGIWNGFSSRKVGDPALLAELPVGPSSESGVFGPYEKVATDGRRITSVSIVLPDDAGHPLGVLCVNLDRSPMDNVIDVLRAMVTPATDDFPPALLDRDWREQIALTVDHWCKKNMVDRRKLVRAQRLQIIRVLDDADLFTTRHAAQHVSVALGVSRATVYSMLSEVRGSDPDTVAIS